MRVFMYTCILYMHIISHNGYGQQTPNYVPSRKGKPHVITAKENLEYQPHCTALHRIALQYYLAYGIGTRRPRAC